MREYSVTLVFTLLLVCAAVLLALWLINDTKTAAENSGDPSLPSYGEISGKTNSGGESPAGKHPGASSPESAPSAESENTPSETEPEPSPGPEPGEPSENESSDASSVPANFEYSFDITPYLKYIEPEDQRRYALLVNKETPPLGPEYAPKEPVLLKNARPGREDQCYMDATAAKALEAFLKEASLAGFTDISVTNAYRSYATQYYLFYDYYFKQEAFSHPGKSQKEILALVAAYCFPPGQSEHQTGLCCDMHNVPVGEQERFNNTDAALWLQENAHRFGFILRYPEGKEETTGAVYESWHFRFVGRTIAVLLYTNDMTLDEFYSSGLVYKFFAEQF